MNFPENSLGFARCDGAQFTSFQFDKVPSMREDDENWGSDEDSGRETHLSGLSLEEPIVDDQATVECTGKKPGADGGVSAATMGNPRRIAVGILALLGLATFFLPTVHTNPPVQGRAVWSPLQITRSLTDGTLPLVKTLTPEYDPRHLNSRSVLLDRLFGFPLEYLALLVILTCTLFFPSENGTIALGVIGLLPALGEVSAGFTSYRQDLFGPTSPTSNTANAWTNSAIVMTTLVAILLISKWKGLDTTMTVKE